MTDHSVWVKLANINDSMVNYDAFEVTSNPLNVGRLKEAIIAKAKLLLGFDVFQLSVYPPGTAFNHDGSTDVKAYSAGMPCSDLHENSYEYPIIVTAQSRQDHRGTRQEKQQLLLFPLEYRQVPSGSSGVPHIPRNLDEFPLSQLKPLVVKESHTPLFRRHHVGTTSGKVYYTREHQVQSHLDNVVKDVIESCNYELTTDTEAALNGLRVDIGFLRNENGFLCGTMEVKQPKRIETHPDPMNHPSVIAQVLSQMIPLRTMYGVQTVYGILSSYSSWRFFKWAPQYESAHALVPSEPQFVTPRKELVGATARHKYWSKSPDRIMSPRPYRDSCQATEEEGNDDGDDVAVMERGVLYASEVISNGPRALRILAWVLGEMATAEIRDVPAHERDFLYVITKQGLGGFERLPHNISFYKGRMPRANITKLYILEELGIPYHGRVFRAMSSCGCLCVIKFFVKSQDFFQDNKLIRLTPQQVAEKSVGYWNLAYNNWLPDAHYGPWGGGDAMLMPDLERMTMNEDSSAVIVKLKETMKERFHGKGLWHDDVAWRNVALVRGENGDILKACMIDLDPERMMEWTESSMWDDFETMWSGVQQQLVTDWDAFVASELAGYL